MFIRLYEYKDENAKHIHYTDDPQKLKIVGHEIKESLLVYDECTKIVYYKYAECGIGYMSPYIDSLGKYVRFKEIGHLLEEIK